MIQRADHVYRARLFLKLQDGGHWHRHLQGVEPFAPQGVAIGVSLVPRINHGMWIVDCPNLACNSAQLAGPDGPGHDRFFCVDCLNADVAGQWIQVDWPSPSDVAAVEAALDARPSLITRNWDHTETIGALLVENVVHGELYDPVTGEVAGDVGADQGRQLVAPKGVRTLPRPEA